MSDTYRPGVTQLWAKGGGGNILTFCRCRGVINGKAGKAAALSKFSYTLTLSRPSIALALPDLKFSVITLLSNYMYLYIH